MTDASEILWYKRPAKTWVHSLLLGNGSFGAALYGRTDKETVELNLDTLWSGYPGKKPEFKTDPYETFTKARELSLQNKNHEAQVLLEKELAVSNSQYYLPLGKMIISSKSNLKPRNYRRQLDLKTAVHSVEYKLKNTLYSQQSFVSFPDDVFVMKTAADGEEKINISVTFSNEVHHDVYTDGEYLILEGQAPSEITDEGEDIYLEGDKAGMKFCCVLGVKTDGNVKYNKKSISVSDAGYLTFIAGGETSFKKWNEIPDKDYLEPCKEKVAKAMEKSFDALLESHVEDYKSLYSRVSLDLGNENKAGVVTSSRLLHFMRLKNDIELYALLFNFGRYLAIASSRQGTQATNLQGIWTYRKLSPWRANYTVNINTEMNYWPVLPCSMPELQTPLNSFVDELSQAGVESADNIYHARGFACHHNVDIWRHNAPVKGSAGWSFWYMAGAWLSRHLYEYYEYTLDKAFLKDTAYPVILKSASFLLDILTPDKDGYLIACPSTSPENCFYDKDNNRISVSQTTTMTMGIIKENFLNALSCAEILGDSNEILEEIKEKLPKLLPFKIGDDGRLLEWYYDEKEEDIHHRHVSHLYSLYPANLINTEDTPELVEAAKATLNKRGDKGTGWSLGWKINFYARLCDGNRALKLINNQLHYIPDPDMRGRGGTYPNMLDAHPPFQIDGNFGAVSGIAQLMLQSRNGKIYILPALPDKWSTGSVKGLSAKGNVTVDIEWKDGKLTSLKARGKGEHQFVYAGKTVTKLLDGETLIGDFT